MKTNTIEKHLLNYLKKRPDFLVLTTNYDWNVLFEADVFQITKDREIIEFEIKSTRGDFLKDKLKSKTYYNHLEKTYSHLKKYDFLLGKEKSKNGSYNLHRPNKFYYVTHSNIITKSEVDPNFGIIKVLDSGQVYIEKRAKKLHNEKNGIDKIVIEVARNFCLKKCSI